ncbi:hypothetical protein B0T19DRAFT_229532 [Cercophora scortea]|uniref:Uncharacterized protein n=1 Tax=Cercophora scortea TaxID=314031 RepID=A0AAE0M9H5_9PEZI|nr:hypothetical protein B0T19DRAFT_229532 [Cercophora scortea]
MQLERYACHTTKAVSNARICSRSSQSSAAEPVEAGNVCRCSDNWSDGLRTFVWQDTVYYALTLTSTRDMLSIKPTTQMQVQAFFNYNSSKARDDSSHVLSPSLWLAIYDPTLTLDQALDAGYTRMVLINANGIVAINLGLSQREALNRKPAYDYQLSVSTIPASDLLCDVASSVHQSGPCFLSLFLTFPTFDRQVSRQSFELSWQDAITAAGSWFSLFQLAGWIFSGAALHP